MVAAANISAMLSKPWYTGNAFFDPINYFKNHVIYLTSYLHKIINTDWLQSTLHNESLISDHFITNGARSEHNVDRISGLEIIRAEQVNNAEKLRQQKDRTVSMLFRNMVIREVPRHYVAELASHNFRYGTYIFNQLGKYFLCRPSHTLLKPPWEPAYSEAKQVFLTTKYCLAVFRFYTRISWRLFRSSGESTTEEAFCSPALFKKRSYITVG